MLNNLVNIIIIISIITIVIYVCIYNICEASNVRQNGIPVNSRNSIAENIQSENRERIISVI